MTPQDTESETNQDICFINPPGESEYTHFGKWEVVEVCRPRRDSEVKILINIRGLIKAKIFIF